jgi:hypothetical protein
MDVHEVISPLHAMDTKREPSSLEEFKVSPSAKIVLKAVFSKRAFFLAVVLALLPVAFSYLSVVYSEYTEEHPILSCSLDTASSVNSTLKVTVEDCILCNDDKLFVVVIPGGDVWMQAVWQFGSWTFTSAELLVIYSELASRRAMRLVSHGVFVR